VYGLSDKVKILKKKDIPDSFKRWGSLGKMDIAGHKLVRGPTGSRLDQLGEGDYLIVDRPYDIMYHHSYGRVSPFFQGLLDKKFLGTKCPQCGDVFFPPRVHCWRPACRLKETQWIEMPQTGILHSFTILGFAATAFLPDLPFVLGYVRVEGANTLIASRILEVDPLDVHPDMKVKAEFVDSPKGTPLDFYFVPDQEPRKDFLTPQQKAQLDKKLEVIRSWVNQRFR